MFVLWNNKGVNASDHQPLISSSTCVVFTPLIDESLIRRYDFSVHKFFRTSFPS